MSRWRNVGIPARDVADIFVGCRQDVGTMSAADGPFMADARGLTMLCGREVGIVGIARSGTHQVIWRTCYGLLGDRE